MSKISFHLFQSFRWGAAHGYGISQAIRTGSNELFRVETGSLYPAPSGSRSAGS